MQTMSHAAEGFGLAWSPHTVGALASGDCRGKLHTWAPREGGSWAASGAYAGHGGSVEDIEWSPSEGSVLATACVDKVPSHHAFDHKNPLSLLHRFCKQTTACVSVLHRNSSDFRPVDRPSPS